MEKTSVADEVAAIKIKNIIKAMPPTEQAGAVEGIRDDCLWKEIKRRFGVLWNDFDGVVMDLGENPRYDREEELATLIEMEKCYYEKKEKLVKAWKRMDSKKRRKNEEI